MEEVVRILGIIGCVVVGTFIIFLLALPNSRVHDVPPAQYNLPVKPPKQ